MSPGTPPVALTIAGSDSGGGAGIQADLATFAAFGVHGASAVTAVTVQDTTGVHLIHPVPAEVVVAQVEAVVTDLRPASVKTGMLGDTDTTRAVGALAAQGLLPHLVVDPVLVSTSGQRLAAGGVVAALREHLLPHAAVMTPNTDEAAALLGCDRATSLDEQKAQARALLDLGCAAVVVTGGTFRRAPAGSRPVPHAERTDVLATGQGLLVLTDAEIDTTNDHGTGCTFASAISASLAAGLPVTDAVQVARSFVRQALRRSAPWRLGHGRGPVSHLGPQALGSGSTEPTEHASPTRQVQSTEPTQPDTSRGESA